MQQEYTTIYSPAEDEFVERKSRFIGHIAPVQTEEEAQAFIAQIRQQHRDATHNTYAYILRSGIKRYSDDGEPQGTAGVPMLECVEKEGLVDVAVVVTRYFGGILLAQGAGAGLLPRGEDCGRRRPAQADDHLRGALDGAGLFFLWEADLHPAQLHLPGGGHRLWRGGEDAGSV